MVPAPGPGTREGARGKWFRATGYARAVDQPTRVLVADDHQLMREGTAALLAADERLEVVGLARDGREALALADRRAPDVVLLDLNMPVRRRPRGVRAAAPRPPGPEVLDAHGLRGGARPVRRAARRRGAAT